MDAQVRPRAASARFLCAGQVRPQGVRLHIRRAAELILLVAPAIALATGAAVSFDAGAPIELPSHEAMALFKQCSRNAPAPDKVLGAPTPGEVASLEAQVARYVAELAKSGKRVPPPGTYARQYVSFMEGGKRKVYANYFPPSVQKQLFRGHAVIVCDGGSQFWGVVYDLERDVLEQLEMNGAA